jgi:hypothetical protein
MTVWWTLYFATFPSTLLVAGCGGPEYLRLRSSAPTEDAGASIDESETVRKNILASQGGTISLSETGESALANVLVTIPAGALAIDTEISVTESTAVANPTTFSELGISTGVAAGPAIAVEARDMDALTGSLQISLPYQATSLLLADDQVQFAVVGVYRKYGKMFAETYVGSELSLGDKTIDVSVRNFGSFQAIRVRENLAKQSVETTTSYVSRAQAKAAGADGYTAFLVQNTSNLPSCDATRISHLYYVINASSFYTCDGSAWTPINIKGEKGDRGERGEDGSQSSGVTGYFVRDASGYDMGNLVGTSLPWEPITSASGMPMPETNRYLLHRADIDLYYGVDSLGNVVAPIAYQAFANADCLGTASGALSLWSLGSGTLIEIGGSRFKVNSTFPTIKSTHVNGSCLVQMAYPVGETSEYSSSEIGVSAISIGTGRIVTHRVDSRPVIQGCAANCNNFVNWRKLSLMPPVDISASALSYPGTRIVASSSHLYAFVVVDGGSGINSSIKTFAATCQFSGNNRSLSTCLASRSSWTWRALPILDIVRADSADGLNGLGAAIVNGHLALVATTQSDSSGYQYDGIVAACPLSDPSNCVGSGGWSVSTAADNLAGSQLRHPQISFLDNSSYMLSYYTGNSNVNIKIQTSASLSGGWVAPTTANSDFDRQSQMVRQGTIAHRAFLRYTGAYEIALSTCSNESCSSWSAMTPIDSDQGFVDSSSQPYLYKASDSDRLVLAYSVKPVSGSNARRIRILTCDSDCGTSSSWTSPADLTILGETGWDFAVVGAYLGGDKLSLQLLRSSPSRLHNLECSYTVNTASTPDSLSVSCDGVVLPGIQGLETVTGLPDSFVPPLSVLQR